MERGANFTFGVSLQMCFHMRLCMVESCGTVIGCAINLYVRTGMSCTFTDRMCSGRDSDRGMRAEKKLRISLTSRFILLTAWSLVQMYTPRVRVYGSGLLRVAI